MSNTQNPSDTQATFMSPYKTHPTLVICLAAMALPCVRTNFQGRLIECGFMLIQQEITK